MKKSGWTHKVRCPNDECEEYVDCCYYPGSPGQTYGPPERCYPPEGDDIDIPAECPHCGYEFTDDDLDRFCETLAEEESAHANRY